jgi:hypothetical protein
MTAKDIKDRLESIAAAEDFQGASAELTEAWSVKGVGAESVEPILRFMEEHPSLDFGVPGALVHFLEDQEDQEGYEEKLIKSVSRKPTIMTAWMLNRVINGTESPEKKQNLLTVMIRAARNPNADAGTRSRINHFLLVQRKKRT